jgi:succinoglycan biosynthesis protein ExoO
MFASAFIRRHRLAYDESMRLGEDYIIMAEALACGAKCVTHAIPGYFYTRRVGSISRHISAKDWDGIAGGRPHLFAEIPAHW